MDQYGSPTAKQVGDAEGIVVTAAEIERAPADAEHLPTTRAAERAGLTPASFRGAMMRLRESGGPDLRRPGPDARTPLWDAAALDAWLASRPGRWPDRPTDRPADRAKELS